MLPCVENKAGHQAADGTQTFVPQQSPAKHVSDVPVQATPDEPCCIVFNDAINQLAHQQEYQHNEAGSGCTSSSSGELVLQCPEDVDEPGLQQSELGLGAMGPGLAIEFCLPPPLKDAEEALEAIQHLLKPPYTSGVGYYWAKFPSTLKERLEGMKTLLWLFYDATRKVEEQGGFSP